MLEVQEHTDTHSLWMTGYLLQLLIEREGEAENFVALFVSVNTIRILLICAQQYSDVLEKQLHDDSLREEEELLNRHADFRPAV